MLVRVVALFSVVRGYNILMVTLAQYLAAIFIMAPDWPLKKVVLDMNLFMLVTASALSIAAGYIINNFYDAEKDLINKPRKSMLDRLVPQRIKISAYFVLNFLAVCCASYVSFRGVLFFSIFIFVIWFYSHKLKRLPLLGNLVSAILAITPFFAVFIYFKNFESVIFVHAIFLFLLILAREMIKDLENIAGDIAHNYSTAPIYYGTTFSKIFITSLLVLTVIPSWLLIAMFNVGNMTYYFIAAIMLLPICVFLLWKSDAKKHFVWLHNILKLIIISGVFSILLINMEVVLNKFLP